MTCKEIQENLALYLYDELPAEERGSWKTHLASCASCQAALGEAQRLHELLRQRRVTEPSPELLVQCRQALDEALDREEVGWRALVPRWLAGSNAIPTSRAVFALTMLVLGIGLGWTLRSRPVAVGTGPQIFNNASILNPDLDNMEIRDISRVAPDPNTGEVHITLDAERRVTLQGSLDDPHIQQVLVYAVRNYNNPGIRRDTVDALRGRSGNPSIREALLFAMRHDPNAGVRLEALETVEAMEWSPEVREALLETVKRDTNPGARVAAINALVKHADPEALPVLQQLASSDPSRYVRLKCASAVRELGGNDF